MVRFVFPGHNYLGPGNALNSGDPVDTDDSIAREHDMAYESAECAGDVHRADKRAISSFCFDCWANKNWHSALGVIGLSLKLCFETLCMRVFYPNLESK